MAEQTQTQRRGQLKQYTAARNTAELLRWADMVCSTLDGEQSADCIVVLMLSYLMVCDQFVRGALAPDDEQCTKDDRRRMSEFVKRGSMALADTLELLSGATSEQLKLLAVAPAIPADEKPN